MSEHTGDIYTQSQHEKEMTRLEVQCKRWFIAFLVVLAMLFVTNVAWVVYENQYQDVVITQEGSTDQGGSNFFNGTGEMNTNGEGKTDNPNPGEAGE